MQKQLDIQPLNAFTKGQDWRLSLLHEDQRELLIWVTRGQGLLQLKGSRRGVGPHNAILIPRGHVFALDLGRKATALIASLPHEQDSWGLAEPLQLRLLDPNKISELTRLLEAAQKEVLQDQPFLEEALSAHQNLIAVWIKREIAQSAFSPNKVKASERLITRYFDNIANSDMQGWPIAQHAKALGVTPTHLTRASRETTGQTAADHLTARALHHAQTALFDSRKTAKQIASDLHFCSAPYFTRFIQHHTGLTPSQLRQRG